MKNPQLYFDSSAPDSMTPEAVEEHNREMRAKANPEVGAIMDEVQTALDSENSELDARFEGEQRLRVWAEKLCGVALDMTEIEDLNEAVKILSKGQVYTFTPKRVKSKAEGRVPVTVYKTAFGTIDRLDNYIFVLEKAIVDLSQPKQISAGTAEQFTELSFFGLIKLAFKRLFTRSK